MFNYINIGVFVNMTSEKMKSQENDFLTIFFVSFFSRFSLFHFFGSPSHAAVSSNPPKHKHLFCVASMLMCMDAYLFSNNNKTLFTPDEEGFLAVEHFHVFVIILIIMCL